MTIDRRILSILYYNGIDDANKVEKFIGENDNFYEVIIDGELKKLKIPGKDYVEVLFEEVKKSFIEEVKEIKSDILENINEVITFVKEEVKEIPVETKEEIEEFCGLARAVIYSNPYYQEKGKLEEAEEYTPEIVAKKIQQKTDEYFGAFDHGYDPPMLIGFCHGYYDLGTFWINWIGVRPLWRRYGYASKLIEYVEKFLQRKKVHKIWLDTKQDNIESISFFHKHKYKIFSSVKNHWYHADFYFWEKLLR